MADHMFDLDMVRRKRKHALTNSAAPITSCSVCAPRSSRSPLLQARINLINITDADESSSFIFSWYRSHEITQEQGDLGAVNEPLNRNRLCDTVLSRWGKQRMVLRQQLLRKEHWMLERRVPQPTLQRMPLVRPRSHLCKVCRWDQGLIIPRMGLGRTGLWVMAATMLKGHQEELPTHIIARCRSRSK